MKLNIGWYLSHISLYHDRCPRIDIIWKSAQFVEFVLSMAIGVNAEEVLHRALDLSSLSCHTRHLLFFLWFLR